MKGLRVSLLTASFLFAILAIAGRLVVLLDMRRSEIRPGRQIAPLTGRGGNGDPVAERPGVRHSCNLVRYTSERCPYCRADERSLKEAEAMAIRAGCKVWLISPTVLEAPQLSGLDVFNPHLAVVAFPSVDFSRSINLQLTPTTFLADGQWRLLWVKQGMLEPADLAALGSHLSVG